MTQGFIREGLTTLDTGNTLWVDAVFGDDATALPERMDKPYLTPEAAVAAASDGDLIYVRPGTYVLAGAIAKNGVNWYLEPGVVFNRTDTIGEGIFDDLGAEVACTVSGNGVLNLTSDQNAIQGPGIARTSHPDSNILVVCDSMTASGTVSGDPWTGCVIGIQGTLTVFCYGTIASTGDQFATYWKDGDTFVRASTVIGVRNGAMYSHLESSDPPAGKMWLQADLILGPEDCESDLLTDGSTGSDATKAQVWVRALEIVNRGVGGAVNHFGNAKFYVEAQKISSAESSTVFKNSDATGVLWVSAQKMTSGTMGVLVQEGDAFVDVMHMEEGASTTDLISVTGGSLVLSGQYAKVASSNGINMSDGTARISGMSIDTSDSNSINPIVVSGGTLILKSCTLVAEATQDSIEAASPQTVISYGSYANTSPDANVSVSGDFTIGAYVQ